MAQTNIVTQEIAREEWPQYLQAFSRQHQGWIVSVHVFGQDIGAQVQADGLPIQDISAELREPGKDEISIILGRPNEAPWQKIIPGPMHVRFESTIEGEHLSLQIEAADGYTTLIKFRVSANPEEVNGFLPGR